MYVYIFTLDTYNAIMHLQLSLPSFLLCFLSIYFWKERERERSDGNHFIWNIQLDFHGLSFTLYNSNVHWRRMAMAFI